MKRIGAGWFDLVGTVCPLSRGLGCGLWAVSEKCESLFLLRFMFRWVAGTSTLQAYKSLWTGFQSSMVAHPDSMPSIVTRTYLDFAVNETCSFCIARGLFDSWTLVQSLPLSEILTQ